MMPGEPRPNRPLDILDSFHLVRKSPGRDTVAIHRQLPTFPRCRRGNFLHFALEFPTGPFGRPFSLFLFPRGFVFLSSVRLWAGILLAGFRITPKLATSTFYPFIAD